MVWNEDVVPLADDEIRRASFDKRLCRTEDIVGNLDFDTLERMPASFVTKHLGRRYADMLWKIRTADPDWPLLLVLTEFQSTVDRRMAARMMNYASGIAMGLADDDLGPGGTSRPSSPSSYTTASSAGTRRPTYATSWSGCRTRIFSSVCRKQEDRMTTLIERARQWGEELNQQWLEKGIERGRVEGERELVLRLVTRRFGPRAVERLGPLLDAVSDPKRIAAVADAVLECATAEEFIAEARAAASGRRDHGLPGDDISRA